MQRGIALKELLSRQEIVKQHLTEPEKVKEFEKCFNPLTGLQFLDKIYASSGLYV